MTKNMDKKLIPISRSRGFTLIEMLVVAALIAIFAGLAVFNIVEQLERQKSKAAIAECRSIATAMSFAYEDMGFFPKLCFLKFGVDGLLLEINDENLSDDAIDWFGKGGGSPGAMLNRIQKNWGEKYMSGSMPEKFVEMTFPSTGGLETVDWPADPWMQPYMAYLLEVEAPVGNPTGTPVIDWANDSLGDKANYFAGIVSYGRNKVPGQTWPIDDLADPVAAAALGLFDNGGDTNVRTFSTDPTNVYTPARRDVFVLESGTPVTQPNMRDDTSDDIYYEF